MVEQCFLLGASGLNPLGIWSQNLQISRCEDVYLYTGAMIFDGNRSGIPVMNE